MGIADRLRRLFGGDAPGDQPADAPAAEDEDSAADEDEPGESEDPTTYPLW